MIKPQNYEHLTQPERAELRANYVKEQKGLCHHCAGPLDREPSERMQSIPINWRLFPKNFLKWPVHLHHNHRTGMTIGAVHALCNAVLWQHHGE